MYCDLEELSPKQGERGRKSESKHLMSPFVRFVLDFSLIEVQ